MEINLWAWSSANNWVYLYPPQTKFGGVYRNHPVCLSVCPSVQSKLNLGYNFSTKRDKALIWHTLVPCDKTFLPVPKILTLWPWPWLLTYFCKNLTLAITFEPREIRLSYYRHAFLAARPFCPYQKYWPGDLDLDFWPTFEKNLTLAIIFESKEIRLSYYTCWFLVTRPFCLHQKIWPCNLDLDFWPLFDLILHTSIPYDKTFLLIPIFWPSGFDLIFDLLLEKLEFVAAGGISPVRTDPDLVWVEMTHVIHDERMTPLDDF